MKTFKTLCLILIFFVTIFSGWLYFLGMGVNRTALNLSYYQEALEMVGLSSLYDNMPEFMEERDHGEETSEKEFAEYQENEMEEFPEEPPEELFEIIQESLAEAFHEEWLKKQMLFAVEDSLAYIKGEQDDLTAVIGLKERKEIYRTALLNGMDEYFVCQSEEGDYKDENEEPEGIAFLEADSIEEEIDGMLAEMDIPDELVLSELSGVNEAVTYTRNFYTYFSFVPYIVFVLLFGFFCLLSSGLKGAKWFGTAAMVSGVSFASVLFFSKSAFLVPAAQEISNDSPFSIEAVVSVFEHTISFWYAAPVIFTVLGAALIIIGVAGGKKKIGFETEENLEVSR